LEKVTFHLYLESKALRFPTNFLRNIALDQVKSDYFAILDVDLFPSPIDTHQHLRSIFDKNPHHEKKLKNRSVFVFPAFEIADEIPDKNVTANHLFYPETKEIALRMYNVKQINIFYFDRFEPSHRATNYDLWKSNSTDITYHINATEWGYEPYFIGAKKNIPRYYRYFRGHGFDKVSFTTDLLYSGYSFEVLRDFFIFHVNHPIAPKMKKKADVKLNRICIKGFMDHLVKEYGDGSIEKVKNLPLWNDWKKKSGWGRN